MAVLRDQRLLEIALHSDFLDEDELDRLRLRARKEHRDLLSLVCYEKRIPTSLLYRCYAETQQLHFQDVQVQPDMQQLRRLGIERATQYLLLPFMGHDKTSLILLCANPEDRGVKQTAKRLLNRDFTWAVAVPELIERTLVKFAPLLNPYQDQATVPDFDPVTTLDDLLNQAYLRRASDMHLEPAAEGLAARYRIDGRLQPEGRLFSDIQGAALISRVKVLAELDIAESRMPQDGAMTHTTPLDQAIDIRVATMPTQFGERATLRLLGGDNTLLSLQEIGMAKAHLTLFDHTIKQPHGIILITGPTGSGKSTTLYAALNELADQEINILTAEDPVEMTIPGLSQLQVSSKTGFAGALRSFLRHDPDVIMVGEIRDRETAEIAMQAALTGHLVFSTLHTNSAPDSIPRLLDIGVEPYLAASTLLCVIAQRLVRKLCLHCRKPQSLSEKQRQWLQCDIDAMIFQAAGCAQCSGLGYQGRLPLFEFLWVDEALSEAIALGRSQEELLQQATDYLTLAEDGKSKLLQGLTTLQELQRLGIGLDWDDMKEMNEHVI